MKSTLLICLVLGVSVTLSHPLDQDLEHQWKVFKMTHNREFESHDEELMRKSIFDKNARMIHLHNMQYSRGLKSYTMKLNKYADWTEEEMSEMMGNKDISDVNGLKASKFLIPLNIGELPDRLDWRERNLVTPVKHQASCGSCYAFAGLGAVEGQIARKTGKNPVSLSAQNIVDCSVSYGNQGCDGGHAWRVFEYVKDHGVDTEESYPYLHKNINQTCKFKPEKVGARVRGYVNITEGDEKELMIALATVGPISVSLDSNHTSFKMYAEGIYYNPKCTEDLVHAVLLVGYGTENGEDYWIIKNSWSELWGENGYGRIRRNINHCGIANRAVYPLV